MLNKLKETLQGFKWAGTAKTQADSIDAEPLGDGKAVFLSDMTEDEYQEYVRNEENGWKKFKEKIGL